MILSQKVLHSANTKINIENTDAVTTSKIIDIPENIKHVTINSRNLLSLT